jgi:hypothetical protein
MNSISFLIPLLLSLLLLLGMQIYGEVLCFPKQDVAYASLANQSVSNAVLTSRFSEQVVAYQEEHIVKVKFNSIDNSSYTTEPEIIISTTGTVLAITQSISTVAVFFREENSGNVFARFINAFTFAVTPDNPVAVMSFNDSSGGVSAAFTNGNGFVVWGTSNTDNRFVVKKQGDNFASSPSFENVLVNNATVGQIVASVVDSDETLFFIIKKQSGIGYTSGFYAAKISDSLFSQSKVTLRGVDVPIPENDVVRAVASSAKNKFMVITSSERDGATILKTLHTSNTGGSWLEAFEVGSFLPNPSSQLMIQAIFTSDKWLVFLDSADGFLALSTMTASVPFEFDWRAALKAANLIKFNGSTGRLAVSANRARLTLIREEPVTTDLSPSKLSLMFCSVSGTEMGISMNISTLLITLAFFIGFVI